MSRNIIFQARNTFGHIFSLNVDFLKRSGIKSFCERGQYDEKNVENRALREGEIAKAFLLEIDGKPLLEHIFLNIKKSKKIQKIVLQTTTLEEDKVLVDIAQRCGVEVMASLEMDMVKRFLDMINTFKPDTVVVEQLSTYFVFTSARNMDLAIKYHEESSFDFTFAENLKQSFFLTVMFKAQSMEEVLNKAPDRYKLDWYIYLMDNPNLYKVGRFKPQVIDIELTNDCNLKCINCPRGKMKRDVGYMDVKLFKKIIDQSCENNISEVNFTLYGEPLLHPQFQDMVNYAKDKDLFAFLYTNGIFLDGEKAKSLLDTGLDGIIFNLDCLDEELYQRLKGEDLYKTAEKNIKDFLKLKKEKIYEKFPLPVCAVQIVKMKETDGIIDQFYKEWSQDVKIKGSFPYECSCSEPFWDLLIWAKAHQNAIELPLEYVVIQKYNNFCGAVEDLSVIDCAPIKRFACKQLKEGISILWNGDVVMCRQDFDARFVIGNLKEKSLDEILNSPERQENIKLQEQGVFDKYLCKDCKDWYYPRS